VSTSQPSFAPSQEPGPGRILATLQGYRDAAALNTAIELDLFTRISHGVDTAPRIASSLNLPLRGVAVLCEYLVNAGMLLKEDDQLKLPPDIAHFLDKQSPHYLGKILPLLHSPELWRGYENLTASVRKGSAVQTNLVSRSTPEWFDLACGTIDSSLAAKAFASALNLPAGPLKILDLACGDSLFGVGLASHYPESVVVAVEHAAALESAQVLADAAKVGSRFQNIPGDPLTAPLGRSYDAAIMTRTLYRFDESETITLLANVHHVLKKTGQLFVLDLLSDTTPSFYHDLIGLRLDLFAATARFDLYPFARLKGLLEASGFHNVKGQALPEARATLVIAHA
jgi:ubiquinone/menaquinone biosynthesis C-methylase UbiE